MLQRIGKESLLLGIGRCGPQIRILRKKTVQEAQRNFWKPIISRENPNREGFGVQ